LKDLTQENDYKLHELAGFILVAVGGLTAFGVANGEWTIWNFVPKIIALVVDLWAVTFGGLLLVPEGKGKQKTIDAILELYAAILGWLTDRIPRKTRVIEPE
jgi:uncharacterized membrane protein